jgi:hypothetical protein
VAHHDPVPITVLEADFPPALNRIVSRAIAKDPAQRYQTGAEMAADIQKLRTARKLDETAGSLAVVSQDSAVAAPSVLQMSALRRPGASAMARVAVNSKPRALKSQSAPRSPSWLGSGKIALAAAVLVMVTSAFGLYLHGRKHSAQTVSASAPLLAALAVKPEARVAEEALSPARSQPARLQIEIEHHFVVARASVWLDNNLVYQRELQGTTKKHALVLQSTLGFDAGTVKLPAGRHNLKVRVQSGIDSYDLTKTVSGTLVSGRQSTLRVTCARQPNLLQVAWR